MKNTFKTLLLLAATLPLSVLANDPIDMTGLTNETNFNPSVSMSGSNVTNQINHNNYSRILQSQCANSSWSLGAYKSNVESHARNWAYGSESNDKGIYGSISGSWGEADRNCLDALSASLNLLKFDHLDKAVTLCYNMHQRGINFDNSLKKEYPALEICSKLNYNEPQVQQVAAQEPLYKKVKKTIITGYKEYRLHFGNAPLCAKCGKHEQLVDYLIKKGIDKKNIFEILYQDNGKNMVSVNIRDNYLTKASATIAGQELLVGLGIKTQIRGVMGTEIYKTVWQNERVE